MRIGAVASGSGVSVRALRYYEEQGLLGSVRSTSGQRTYDEGAIERVRLIQQLYAAGLPSRTIVELLPCVDTGTATPASFALLTAERDRIGEQIRSLQQAQAKLDQVIDIARHPTPEHCPALREPATSAAA